jgi:hypothetical protein
VQQLQQLLRVAGSAACRRVLLCRQACQQGGHAPPCRLLTSRGRAVRHHVRSRRQRAPQGAACRGAGDRDAVGVEADVKRSCLHLNATREGEGD